MTFDSKIITRSCAFLSNGNVIDSYFSIKTFVHCHVKLFLIYIFILFSNSKINLNYFLLYLEYISVFPKKNCFQDEDVKFLLYLNNRCSYCFHFVTAMQAIRWVALGRAALQFKSVLVVVITGNEGEITAKCVTIALQKVRLTSNANTFNNH